MKQKSMNHTVIEAERGIPVPVGGPRSRGAPPKYPWLTMKVNESFKTPLANPRSVATIVCSANKRYDPKRFEWHRVDDGIRIWRIT